MKPKKENSYWVPIKKARPLFAIKKGVYRQDCEIAENRHIVLNLLPREPGPSITPVETGAKLCFVDELFQ